MDKKQLRKAMTERRGGVHGDVDPSAALTNLRDTIGDRAGPIAFYWPIRSEIDPRPVMETLAGAREICLPVTTGYEPLIFREWTPGARMDTDGFGVSVPADGKEVLPKVLVVPMLAFDDAGHRLGYGAGHYDRTLAKLRPLGPAMAIGFAYEAQRVDNLPTEATDQPLDAIVTEAQVRHFSRVT